MMCVMMSFVEFEYVPFPILCVMQLMMWLCNDVFVYDSFSQYLSVFVQPSAELHVLLLFLL